MKVLIYADTPTCNTGFGVVCRNIVAQLLNQIKDVQIDILGINEFGDHHPIRHHKQIKIYPAMDGREVHGRMKLIKFLAEGEYDNVLVIHDLITMLEILDANGDCVASAIKKIKPYKKTRYHMYFPVDVKFQEGLNYDWLQKITAFDTLIPYTQFAKDQIKIAGIETAEPMYHGVDTSQFYPVSRPVRKKLRKDIFGIESNDTKLITIVAKNQWRKDIPAAIEAFARYHKAYNQDSILYIHSIKYDEGGDLTKYTTLYGLEEGKNVIFRQNTDQVRGVDVSSLNDIYNATDMLISCARGEGFGLPYIEAMATKTLIMANNASVEEELLPYQYLWYAGEPVYSGAVDIMPFPRTTVTDSWSFAEEMLRLFKEDTNVLTGIKNKAYNRVKKDFDWKTEVQKLVEIFKK